MTKHLTNFLLALIFLALVGIFINVALSGPPDAPVAMRAVAPYQGNAADGVTTTVNSMLVGGKTYTGGAQSLRTDTDGALHIIPAGPSTVTLSAGDPLPVTITEPITVIQSDADLLLVNANIQQGDADIAIGNPLYITPTQDLSVQLRGYNGTSWRDVRVDKSTDNFQIVDNAHHQIHAGSAYAVHVFDLDWDKSDTMNVCFTTPASASWLHVVPMVDASTATTFTISEGATADPAGGASYLARNRNRNAVGTLTSTITSLAGVAGYATLGTTISTTGVLVHAEALGQGKQGGTGMGTRDTAEYVLLADTLYCFSMVSWTIADNGVASMEITWYELADLVAAGW